MRFSTFHAVYNYTESMQLVEIPGPFRGGTTRPPQLLKAFSVRKFVMDCFWTERKKELAEKKNDNIAFVFLFVPHEWN